LLDLESILLLSTEAVDDTFLDIYVKVPKLVDGVYDFSKLFIVPEVVSDVFSCV
jgi:hypothetical protein